MRSSTSQPGLLARRLHGVHDLAREPLAAQLVVQLQVQRHRVRAGALDLVAVERLQHELDVVGAERVLLAVDVDRPRSPPSRSRGAGRAPRSPPATCGICLPKRGPSAR